MLTSDQQQRARYLKKFRRHPAEEYRDVHEQASLDRNFYPRLAVWLANSGHMDHIPLFMMNLIGEDHPGWRETASRILHILNPAELSLTLKLIKGQKKNVPRMIKSSIAAYLSRLQDDPQNFDRIIFKYRKELKQIYAGLHLRPDARTDAILFKNRPPEDSMIAALKQLAASDNTQQQIELINRFAFPLQSIGNAIKSMSPEVAEKIVDQLDRQQLTLELDLLGKMGVLAHASVLTRVRTILNRIPKSKKPQKTIHRTTALIVVANHDQDTPAIAGQRLATLLAPHAPQLRVFWCGKNLYELNVSDSGLTAWAEAFANIPTNRRVRKPVLDFLENLEQLVLIHGNQPTPLISEIFQACARQPLQPDVTLVPVTSTHYTDIAGVFSLPVQTFQFKGEYDVLHDIAYDLTGPTLQTMLEEIEQIELPPEHLPQTFKG